MTSETSYEEELVAEFERMGALLEGHFVLTSRPDGSPNRRHGNAYVNKDVISSFPNDVYEIAGYVADQNSWHGKVDLVVAPAVGAIVFGSMIANAAGARFAYAEPDGDELVFNRGFASLIKPGVRVVIAEDIVTSGSTVSKMIEAVQKLGGEVVAVIILWQRGEVDLKGVPIIALVKKEYSTSTAEECELCREGVRPNTDVGHGAEFLEEFGDDPAKWPANLVA